MQILNQNAGFNHYQYLSKPVKKQNTEQPAQIPAQEIKIPAYAYRNRVNFGSTSIKEMYTELSKADEGQRILDKLEQEQKNCLKAMLNVYIKEINKAFPDGRVIWPKSNYSGGPKSDYTTDSLVTDLRKGDLKDIPATELKKAIDDEFDRKYKPLLSEEREEYYAEVTEAAKSSGIEITPEDLQNGFITPVIYKQQKDDYTPEIKGAEKWNIPNRYKTGYVFTYEPNYNPESKPGTKTISFCQDDKIHNVDLMDIEYQGAGTLSSKLSSIPVCKDAHEMDTEIKYGYDSDDCETYSYKVYGHKGFRLDHNSPTLNWGKLPEFYSEISSFPYIFSITGIKEGLTKFAYEKFLGKTPEQIASEKKLQESMPAINNVLASMDD